MVDSGTQLQLDKRNEIALKLNSLKFMGQLLFAAAICERLLPCARASLSSWRANCWDVPRQTLDNIWNYVSCPKSLDEELADIREKCSQCLPDDEDPSWDGSFGSFEAAAAVTYAVDLLIDQHTENAMRVSNQALNAIESFLGKKMFPNTHTGDGIDYRAIFNDELMQKEIRLQEADLIVLSKTNIGDELTSEEIKLIKQRAIDNPLKLR